MSKAMRAVGEDVWKTKVDKVVSMEGGRMSQTPTEEGHNDNVRYNGERI